MRTVMKVGALAALASLAMACGGGSSDRSGGGTATIFLGGVTYEVKDVSMVFEPGEDAWFRIEGEPRENPDQDCVVGLGGGMGLYGDLPASVRKPEDLAGKRLRVDFTGDGDDANLCFVGMGGLAGAEDAWVTIKSVDGDEVQFTMSGTFKVYDEDGNGPIKTASASGSAVLRSDS